MIKNHQINFPIRLLLRISLFAAGMRCEAVQFVLFTFTLCENGRLIYLLLLPHCHQLIRELIFLAINIALQLFSRSPPAKSFFPRHRSKIKSIWYRLTVLMRLLCQLNVLSDCPIPVAVLVQIQLVIVFLELSNRAIWSDRIDRTLLPCLCYRLVNQFYRRR